MVIFILSIILLWICIIKLISLLADCCVNIYFHLDGNLYIRCQFICIPNSVIECSEILHSRSFTNITSISGWGSNMRGIITHRYISENGWCIAIICIRVDPIANNKAVNTKTSPSTSCTVILTNAGSNSSAYWILHIYCINHGSAITIFEGVGIAVSSVTEFLLLTLGLSVADARPRRPIGKLWFACRGDTTRRRVLCLQDAWRIQCQNGQLQRLRRWQTLRMKAMMLSSHALIAGWWFLGCLVWRVKFTAFMVGRKSAATRTKPFSHDLYIICGKNSDSGGEEICRITIEKIMAGMIPTHAKKIVIVGEEICRNTIEKIMVRIFSYARKKK